MASTPVIKQVSLENQEELNNIGLSIGKSSIHNHGLIARKSMNAGNLLLDIAYRLLYSLGTNILSVFPYVAVPVENSQDICHFCFLPTKLKKCSICKVCKYCDKPCQYNDWKAHQNECIAFTRVNYISPFQRLLFRLIYLLSNPTVELNYTILSTIFREYNLGNETYSSSIKELGNSLLNPLAILQLQENKSLEEYKEILVKQMNITDKNKTINIFDNVSKEYEIINDCLAVKHMFNECKQYYIEKNRGKDVSTVTNDNMYINCWRLIESSKVYIRNDVLKFTGIGIYPVLSYVNHSCNPNCCLVFRGNLATLRTLRNIEEGEELTYSYVDVHRSTFVRKNILRSEFSFDCTCPKCQNATILEEREYYRPSCINKKCNSRLNYRCEKCGSYYTSFQYSLLSLSLTKTQTIIPFLTNVNDAHQMVSVIEDTIATLSTYYNDQYSEIVACRIQLFLFYISIKVYQSALTVGNQLYPSLKSVYKQNEPTVAVINYLMGWLLCITNNCTKSKEYFLTARNILDICQGPDTNHKTLLNQIKNILTLLDDPKSQYNENLQVFFYPITSF
ncbi:hypothetical protein WA158_000871 [Blastocystis sp. Blastoise]